PGADGGSDGTSGSDSSSGGCTGSFSCFCGSPACVNGQWTCPQKCGDTCASLLAEIENERKALRSCCPNCKKLQCQNVAQDVCCQITVNQGDVAGFEATVAKYKKMCSPLCPGTPCPIAPSNTCDPDQGSQTMGYCR